MPAVLKVTPPGGQPIRIGVLSTFDLRFPSDAGHGGTVQRGAEFSFPWVLGGQANNAAAELFFKLQAGDGRGEIKKFTAQIVVHDGARNHVADIDLADASMFYQSESDAHPAPVADFIVVAQKATYTPASGTAIVI